MPASSPPDAARRARAEFPYLRATLVYVFALCLVGAAVLIGYVLVSRLNQRTADDAALVNTAGRQRMLVQRVARLGAELGTDLVPSERRARVQALRDTLRRWQSGHNRIVRQDAASLLSSPRFASGAVHYGSLEASFAAVTRAARQVLEAQAGEPEDARSRAELGAACDAYVVEMDGLVTAFADESEAKVADIGATLQVIVLAAMALLAAEGFLVFRPLIRGLRGAYVELDGARRSLEIELERRREAERTRDVLAGLLPICAGCKRIRDGDGSWTQIERYIEARSEAQFSHGLCEECIRRLYPDHAEAILRELSDSEEKAAAG